MWISKSKYEELKKTVERNVDNAEKYRSLIYDLEYGDAMKIFIVNRTTCVAFNMDTFNKITEKSRMLEDELKELEAELVWYKNKYHEMKMGLK